MAERLFNSHFNISRPVSPKVSCSNLCNSVNINNIDMNDLENPNSNISVCVPSVLCEPNVLCTKKTNLQTNISQNILTKSRCQAQKK